MDSFFQRKEVKDVLLKRAKSADKIGASFSLTDENGTLTSEYLNWQFKSLWAKVTVHLSEKQRTQWFIDNPAPTNKYEVNN